MAATTVTNEEFISARRFVATTVGLVVAMGALILIFAAAEEPYHIDELRQVRSYERPVTGIIVASLGQEQPPLDSVLNAATQRFIGVGDLKQRAWSVSLGIGSLLLLGILLYRGGFRVGVPIGVAFAATSPLLVSVTAYARPYALPTFLTLAFVLGVDVYLRTGRRSVLVLVILVGVLLPISRTIEPELVLLLVATAMALIARMGVGPGTRSRQFTIARLAVSSILIIGLPTIVLLRHQLGEHTVGGPLSNPRGLGRLFSDLPGILADSTPLWPLIAALTLGVFVWPSTRSQVLGLWWWWVLSGTALGFALVFFASTPASQPYFQRYAYTFVLPIAVVVGAAADGLSAARGGWRKRIAIIAVGLAFLAAFSQLSQDLSTTRNVDWEEAAAVLDETLPADAFVLFDSVRDLGLYRTPFAGYPRYTGTTRQIALSLDVIRNPTQVPEGRAVAVLLLGASPEVVGWIRVPAGGEFNLYVAIEELSGSEGVSTAALSFGSAIGDGSGTALTLAGASLLHEAGDSDRAAMVVSDVISRADANLETTIRSLLEPLPLSAVLPPNG